MGTQLLLLILLAGTLLEKQNDISVTVKSDAS